MSISLKQSTVPPGSEVALDIELTNISSQEIQLIHVSDPPLYAFRVLDRNGKEGRLTPVGEAIVSGKNCYKGKNGETRCFVGSAFSHGVAPGGKLHDVFDLSSYVDLSRPNQYSVRLERTDPYTKLLVWSNTITLTVAGRE